MLYGVFFGTKYTNHEDILKFISTMYSFLHALIIKNFYDISLASNFLFDNILKTFSYPSILSLTPL